MLKIEHRPELIIIAGPNGSGKTSVTQKFKDSVQADARNITITAQLTPSEQTIINVTNDGLPISRESQDEIFVPFFTTKQGGTGIGLSLSRQIMRLHNGTLSLTRSDASSTVFTLIFK